MQQISFRAALAAVFLMCLAPLSQAANGTFPDKPLRLVVPFSPGGGTDLVARAVGIGMAQELGQPVVVDNRPGGGTIIGTDNVAKSAPDGYTLVIATFAHAVNPSLQPKLPYDTDKAFAPVVLLGRSPNVLVVRADSPYKTVQDVIQAAKKQPGKISFASQGPGTSAHLAGELFKSLARVDLTHIPYKGAGPAITDLLGGQVDLMFATASAVGNLLEGGKLRALGVTTAQRSTSADLARVPTIAESGVPGYVAESWYGLFVPAGTPAPVIARLNAAATKAANSEAFRKRAEAEGLTIATGTPEDFARYVRAEEGRWSKVVKDAHISLN
ncbi:tripartite tricarboxylate transporter substrate binding protein [Cupriavidus pauculus]|uniref:Tripartite tricarboxylate transporter substrate binding protein n=2 Tax=Burkholderiaceae TaxID=119060 RepID=A0A5P2H2J8_9BURK|nr:tripartite tricarboxylate transporter substrate binding protein [Cupriavidus pauculus]